MTWVHTNPTGVLGMPEATCFAGKRLRRVHLNLRRGHHVILVHEPEGQIAFLLEQSPESVIESDEMLEEQARFDSMCMPIITERGEPLGLVLDVETSAKDGKISYYIISKNNNYGETIKLHAKNAYWWQGQLCCRSRMLSKVREMFRKAKKD